MSSGKIGRFEILSEISRSGVARVYKATDTGSGQVVALKIYDLDQPGIDRQALLNALITEAEGTRDLSHQNIVVLYGAGEIDGLFCASMEYVEGMSLAGMIAKGESFSIWDVLDISRQVCNGLDHAHSRAIFHHRLQPANIVSQWDGTVKILGFGVSAMWAADEAQSEAVSEALSYMSPEQVSGGPMDARSNLYSWGAILYRLLTGHRPFEGETSVEVQQKVLTEQPVLASTLNPKLHAGIAQFLEKALAKEPGARFQTGREMLNALEACKEAPKAAAAPKAATPKATAPPRPAAPAVGPKPPVAVKPVPPAIRSKPTEFVVGPPATESRSAGAAPAAKVPTARKAAAAGVGGQSTASTNRAAAGASVPATEDFVTKCVQASVAAFDEETQVAAPPPPRINVDPMMAQETQEEAAPSGVRSFSEIDELPPLKAAYVEPVHSPEPEQEPEPEVEQLAESPLVKVRQARAEAIKIKLPDLPKVDPKLVMYGVGGAIAVGLVAFAIIGIYVHFQRTEDDGATAPSQAARTETAAQQPAAETQPEQAAPVQEAPVQAAPVAEEASTPARARGRKARPAPAPTPIVIPGQLVVNSTPEGAQIQVDGRFDDTWVTPVTLTGLAPGTHTISVIRSGFNPETRSVDIAQASKSFLVVHLTVQGATVNLTSDPPGAQVLMDGRDTGRVTPVQLMVESGQHNFLIRMQGYLEDSTTANLQAGQSFRFAPALRPLGNVEDIKTVGRFKKLFGGESQAGMGKISIRTNPKGAQIAVNQRLVDRPSPIEFYLNPGNYVLDITATGCKPLRRVISVEKGSKIQLDEVLERE